MNNTDSSSGQQRVEHLYLKNYLTHKISYCSQKKVISKTRENY